MRRKISEDAAELLRRVCKLKRAHTPRLEHTYLELIGARLIGYYVAGRGYFVYSLPRGDEYCIGLESEKRNTQQS